MPVFVWRGNYLLHLLKHMKFGQGFLWVVKVLYKNLYTQVKFRNLRTQNVQADRGTRPEILNLRIIF